MDNKDLIDKLKYEVSIGDRAKKAYDLYVKEFIMAQHAALFGYFINADEEAVLPLKRTCEAFRKLDEAIKQDIETGKLAAKQLETLT